MQVLETAFMLFVDWSAEFDIQVLKMTCKVYVDMVPCLLIDQFLDPGGQTTAFQKERTTRPPITIVKVR